MAGKRKHVLGDATEYPYRGHWIALCGVKWGATAERGSLDFIGWPMFAATVDDAMTRSDEQLLAGVRTLIECAHVLVEPSGAAGLAAAYAGRGALTGKRIVLILTGANITEHQLTAALSGEPLVALEQAVEA